MAEWAGYRWLAQEFNIEPVQPFFKSSQIGKSRATFVDNGVALETYPEAARPVPNVASQLTFALKREGVHLEFLARLFVRLAPDVLNEWINREPSGQYARRAGFFYEWLTGRRLDFAGVAVGNYVSALPEKEYLTASEPVNVARWRVRDNLPGTRDYCPLVRRTAAVQAAGNYDCKARLAEIEAEFGADILLRSAVWLTIKESRASFLIEHEETKADRIKRFAAAMEKWCGKAPSPIDSVFLAQIQREILGERALRTGLRRSPVFIGETGWAGEVVHYVAPHWEQIEPMLSGLRAFALRTSGGPALLRAAVLSFGFVYLHPMADGNGRISRFLVNDTLRRDGALPEPFILPVSSTITHSVTHRAAYDSALENFSKPLMQRYATDVSFGELKTCDDGIQTNFHFGAYDDAQFAWAYPDLTAQTEYLSAVIRETIESEMRQEASFLRDLRLTRERVKAIFEAPDVEIDRLIRSLRENGGSVSNKLRKEFPALEEDALQKAVVEAVIGPTDR